MISQISSRGALRGLAVALALTAGACQMNVAGNQSDGGIGFRQARFAEISAMREYRSCRDDALALDSQARKEGSAARYLASARLLGRCESELGPEAVGVAVEERMQAYALSVQNYVKGGDVGQARKNLAQFQSAFAGQDLYYPDGSSFIETMEILLGLKDRTVIGEFSVANVSSTLKSELRRARYWKKN